ncbi:hypothetical protein BU23DRAFT_639334 [Bimuria novae-zelandiae CBS 107.79]|uniref:Uncharacterized protein n=1 Tax=Bimuria novae-zelandiae CBS 107.79 TaxID=1447943 RepID=A0A6A5VF22_9PLEO|nr:hypothetical protein BU23DRAFT_639334 [Bimuria novae-zelandiae CBS 107.79]
MSTAELSTATLSSQETQHVIKLTLNVHRDLFHAYLELTPHVPLSKITLKIPPGAPIPTYSLKENKHAPAACGLAAFPGLVNSSIAEEHRPQLYTSLLKWNECDFAVQTFLPSLQTQLSDRVPGTQAQWIIVSGVKQKVKFQQSGKGKEPRHSAFLITVPSADGEARFIADFTVEQFGYGSGMWFGPEVEYVAAVTEGGEYVVADMEAELASNKWDGEQKKGQDRLRRICEELRWEGVEKLERKDRVRYLYAYYGNLLQAEESSTENLHKVSLQVVAEAGYLEAGIPIVED